MAFAEGFGFVALAWGFLLGTVAELLLQVPSVVKRRWRPGVDPPDKEWSGPVADGTGPAGGPVVSGVVAETGPRSPWHIAWRSPEVRRVGALLGPVIISLGIVNFNSFIGTIVATLISPEAPAYIDKAFRLFQLPQGMFAIAIGTVLFPTLSRHGAAQRMDEFRSDLSLGIRQIFFVTLPFAAFFSVLSTPTIRLIYEHGVALGDEAAVSGVATSLLFFSVGMAFVSVNTLLNRAFYSLQKAWVPLMMGVVNLAVNAGLMMLLYKPMGVGGITLSTSVVSLINFFGLMVLLSPRIGGVDARRVAWSAGRSIVALIPLALVAYGVWRGLDAVLGRSLWAQIVSVVLAYGAGGLAYLLAAWALRMSELREVTGMVRRRRDRRGLDDTDADVVGTGGAGGVGTGGRRYRRRRPGRRRIGVLERLVVGRGGWVAPPLRLATFTRDDFADLIAVVEDARCLLQWAGQEYRYPLDVAQLEWTLRLGQAPSPSLLASRRCLRTRARRWATRNSWESTRAASTATLGRGARVPDVARPWGWDGRWWDWSWGRLSIAWFGRRCSARVRVQRAAVATYVA